MAELIDHPCVQHKLGIIRDVDTGHKRFRELATEITKFVCYEALKNVKTKEVRVQTPVASMGSIIMQVPPLICGGKRS